MSNVYKIGRLVQFGVAKEVTRGTAPTTASYWPAYDGELVLDEDRKLIMDASTYGIIEDAMGAQIGSQSVNGTLKGPVTNTSFGLFLLSIFGTDTPALHSSETVVYDHVFTVAESAQHQSLSYYIHDSGIADYSYSNGMVSKLEIDYELEKFCAFSATLLAQIGVVKSGGYTPSVTQEARFAAPYGTMKVAALKSGLAAATAIPIKSMKLTIDSQVKPFQASGSASPADFFNQEFKVTGTIEAIYRNESDFKTAFMAATAQALQLSLVNTAVTLGTAANPALIVTLDQVYFEKLAIKRNQKDMIYATMNFTATYDLTNAEMITATLTNLLATY